MEEREERVVDASGHREIWLSLKEGAAGDPAKNLIRQLDQRDKEYDVFLAFLPSSLDFSMP